ncbi:MAG: hypothetical protein KDB01_20805, partial [Planctomycetaceae bacterium]|nr:hypothetical protein [Planctomycetaceae bacterium]
MHIRLRQILILLLAAASLCDQWAQTANASDKLESQYRDQSSKILDTLRSDGIQTVGVLKFSVRIGEGKFPASVGALNTRLVQKLELALVMANPARRGDEAKQVGVIRGASKVAATIEGATHLSADGRKLLFSKTYPLAWKHLGKTDVIPDAFIVGVAQIKSDLSSIQIELMLLKKADLSLTPLAKLTVPTDLEDLIDSGESFTTRGIFDGGSVENSEEKAEKIEETVRKKALLVRTETIEESTPQSSTKHPLSASSDGPIKFEVWYDDELQNYEFRDGAAFIKEPKEEQEVILAVRRKGTDKKRYGILIRVNGENTLYKERTPDAKARLWIMEPDLKEFSIRGYQIDEKERERFRVLSDAESEKRKFDYGQDFGMISVTVFEEQTNIKPELSEEKLDLAVQSQAELPDKTAESRGTLGTSLFEQLLAQDTTRGAIGEGEREA